MSYAIRKDGKGWRSVNSIDDINEDENFSETQPILTETLSDKLLKLAQEYKADLSEFNLAWLAASVSNGATEVVKKEAIAQDIADRKAKYLADVAEAKASFSS